MLPFFKINFQQTEIFEKLLELHNNYVYLIKLIVHANLHQKMFSEKTNEKFVNVIHAKNAK